MQIRHARPGDEAQLAALLEDHERHYGREIADGAGAPGAAFLIEPPAGGPMCLVADAAGKLGGFAILVPYLPAAILAHGLYLKELYVAAGARSACVGEKLRGDPALAKKRGDACVLWTTDEENTGAQHFYDRLGMKRIKKVYYVMDV